MPCRPEIQIQALSRVQYSVTANSSLLQSRTPTDSLAPVVDTDCLIILPSYLPSSVQVTLPCPLLSSHHLLATLLLQILPANPTPNCPSSLVTCLCHYLRLRWGGPPGVWCLEAGFGFQAEFYSGNSAYSSLTPPWQFLPILNGMMPFEPPTDRQTDSYRSSAVSRH